MYAIFYPLGPEYGTTEAAWNGVMREAERLSELHLEVRGQLMNDVHPTVKQWQKDNFHKNMMGVMKESKDMEDNFRRVSIEHLHVTSSMTSPTPPCWRYFFRGRCEIANRLQQFAMIQKQKNLHDKVSLISKKT
jgi:hypothetical protein